MNFFSTSAYHGFVLEASQYDAGNENDYIRPDCVNRKRFDGGGMLFEKGCIGWRSNDVFGSHLVKSHTHRAFSRGTLTTSGVLHVLIENINPIAFTLGPLTVHWYGILMALSIFIGFHYFRRDGVRLGHDEDFLYNLVFIMVIGGIIGARIVYVATNWSAYSGSFLSMIRIDQGGLSFHGAVIGGALTAGLYIHRKKKRILELFDLAIPGLAVGIILVRIGNLFNQEVLGRTTQIGLERHPAQLYASFLGLVLLLIHNYLARKRPPEGYLMWSFVFYYSLFRGLIEETVRDNPLYMLHYVNEKWGIGFFTLTHLITVPLIALALWQRSRIVKQYENYHKVRARR